MSNSEAVPESPTVETRDAQGLGTRAPLLAAIGGCVFAAFWITGVFKISVPWMISLPIHAFAMATFAAGVIALQMRQTEGRAEKGWTWLPALGLAVSVFVSFEVFLISTILFALTAIKLNQLPKLGAILLIAGAVVFLVAYVLHGPFWSDNNPEPAMPLALIFTAGLVLMAAGWVVMATRPRLTSSNRGTVSSRHPSSDSIAEDGFQERSTTP